MFRNSGAINKGKGCFVLCFVTMVPIVRGQGMLVTTNGVSAE